MAKNKTGRSDSRAEMIRKMCVGITKKEGGAIQFNRLKAMLEELLLEPIRSDFLQNTIRHEPRLEFVEKDGHAAVSLAEQNDNSANVEAFVMRALDTLPSEKYPDQFHVVFSGFNRAFREYFPGLDPREEIDKLAAAGKVKTWVCRGGAILARPTAKKKERLVVPEPKDVLSKMGLKK